jgi:hypothetical protein
MNPFFQLITRTTAAKIMVLDFVSVIARLSRT